jgi:hypothetical protein
MESQIGHRPCLSSSCSLMAFRKAVLDGNWVFRQGQEYNSCCGTAGDIFGCGETAIICDWVGPGNDLVSVGKGSEISLSFFFLGIVTDPAELLE